MITIFNNIVHMIPCMVLYPMYMWFQWERAYLAFSEFFLALALWYGYGIWSFSITWWSALEKKQHPQLFYCDFLIHWLLVCPRQLLGSGTSVVFRCSPASLSWRSQPVFPWDESFSIKLLEVRTFCFQIGNSIMSEAAISVPTSSVRPSQRWWGHLHLSFPRPPTGSMQQGGHCVWQPAWSVILCISWAMSGQCRQTPHFIAVCCLWVTITEWRGTSLSTGNTF